MNKFLSSALVAGLLISGSVSYSLAAGGASGPKTFNAVGKIGAVVMNPYGVAPLTAIINNGGYGLGDIKVTVKGKGEKGVDIIYEVSDQKAM